MKNKFLFIIIFSTVSYINAVANPLKIGYVKLDYVMSLLPETKKAQADLKALDRQLKDKLKTKATEFESKLQSFQKEYPTMSETVKSEKEKEIQKLHSEFEKLQQGMQGSLATKQLELVRPIYDKVQKAIQEVAKEHYFTHVLNAGAAGVLVVLYADKEYNLSNLVLNKLGVDSNQAIKTPITAKQESNALSKK
jgi:outer membrane protein